MSKGLDLAAASSDLHCFSGGFFSKGYGFLVPHSSRDGSPLSKVVPRRKEGLQMSLRDLWWLLWLFVVDAPGSVVRCASMQAISEQLRSWISG